MLRPSYVIPLLQFLHKAACIAYKILLLSNKVAKGFTHAYNQGTVQVYTDHLALLVSDERPLSSSFWFLPRLPDFSLYFHVFSHSSLQMCCIYFITFYYNSGVLPAFFYEFNCWAPIKLLGMRMSVKLMKSKCQSFCLLLFFIFSALFLFLGFYKSVVKALNIHLKVTSWVIWAHSILSW